MPRHQHKNTVNKSQGNMAPPEPSYPTTARPKYSNIAEAQENNLKINFMRMTKVLKEEMSRFLREIQENTNK